MISEEERLVSPFSVFSPCQVGKSQPKPVFRLCKLLGRQVKGENYFVAAFIRTCRFVQSCCRTGRERAVGARRLVGRCRGEIAFRRAAFDFQGRCRSDVTVENGFLFCAQDDLVVLHLGVDRQHRAIVDVEVQVA